MRRRLGLVTLILVVLGAGLSVAYTIIFNGTDASVPTFRLAKVERGPVQSTVSASGTLSAVVTVDIGSQVSGLVKELFADFNSEVTSDQVIARIDPASFEAKLVQAQAELTVSRANVAMQRATLVELEADLIGNRAALVEAEKDLKRNRALFAKRIVASSLVDKALAARDQARAKLAGAKAKLTKQRAQIDHALAQVTEKQALHKQRQLDLDHTFIRSPVNGVVINRNVGVGQTVAASLQAPVLFTIAQDLTRMQVEVSVDEADIGQVRVGQNVTFTVDAYPGRTFRGRVHQIRKAGLEVSNVVTYTVIVTADNTDQHLLPGMTANVTVIVNSRKNVLRVLNTALRFTPPGASEQDPAGRPGSATRVNRRARTAQTLDRMTKRLSLSGDQKAAIEAVFRENGQKIRALRQQGTPRSEMRPLIAQIRETSRPRIMALLNEKQRGLYRDMIAARRTSPVRQGRVWMLDADGRPKVVEVAYGVSDGTMSEIVRGKIAAGQEVIVGVTRQTDGSRRSRFRFGL